MPCKSLCSLIIWNPLFEYLPRFEGIETSDSLAASVSAAENSNTCPDSRGLRLSRFFEFIPYLISFEYLPRFEGIETDSISTVSLRVFPTIRIPAPIRGD